MGRSGTEVRKRSHQVNVRLDDEEVVLLFEVARRLDRGLTPPEVMRYCLGRVAQETEEGSLT